MQHFVSLRSFNASRDDSKAKKPKIPTAERQNFNCRELSRLGADFRTFLSDFVASLPQFDFPAVIGSPGGT
jgi:hypothetical protein